MPAVLVTRLLDRTRCFFPSGRQSHSQHSLLPTDKGMAQAELTWVPGSVPGEFTHIKTITHPGTNYVDLTHPGTNYVDRVQHVTTTPHWDH